MMIGKHNSGFVKFTVNGEDWPLFCTYFRTFFVFFSRNFHTFHNFVQMKDKTWTIVVSSCFALSSKYIVAYYSFVALKLVRAQTLCDVFCIPWYSWHFVITCCPPLHCLYCTEIDKWMDKSTDKWQQLGIVDMHTRECWMAVEVPASKQSQVENTIFFYTGHVFWPLVHFFSWLIVGSTQLRTSIGWMPWLGEDQCYMCDEHIHIDISI